ncbi:MAG: DUF1343 domain-containing protein [Gemmatimonadetes bacterium]|nr:DUF1343 domain-containing protein [Gemmatimonadota bacterium]
MHPALPRSAAFSLAPAFALALALAACPASRKDGSAEAGTVAAGPAVRPGIEVLFTDSLALVKGKRVGLITNHTGRDHTGRSDIDLLAERSDLRLVALFSPEHGIRGDEQAGARIQTDRDSATGIPIYSLYGSTLKPTPEMLDSVDVLLFDLQDVGARYYTYMSTLALAMHAAGEKGIPFVVLDRPNPVRGDVVQGNVLDTAYSSFVGRYAEPMRHGLTPGELARLDTGVFGVRADLRVVPMSGWKRDMTYDQTGLPWVAPSPNIPTLESALAYPGTCLFEGTALSVGRGTDHAFEWVGAPWLDGPALADTLNGYHIAGVRFEPATFTPHAPGDRKFPDTEVHGVRLVPTSTDYDAPFAAVAMLVEMRRMSGDHWTWTPTHFDRLAGTDQLRMGIDAGQAAATLTQGWAAQDSTFRTLRTPFLIYP